MKIIGSILALLGVVGLLVFFSIKCDFTSALPYTLFFSVPLIVNLFLSKSVDRPLAHFLNNFSAALYILLFIATSMADPYFVGMLLLATPLGLLLLILFPTLWIVTWMKRDSPQTP